MSSGSENVFGVFWFVFAKLIIELKWNNFSVDYLIRTIRLSLKVAIKESFEILCFLHVPGTVCHSGVNNNFIIQPRAKAFV